MVADQLAQRRLIHLVQDIAEPIRFRTTLGKIDSIGLAKGADQRVPMFSAYFAVLIAVPLETHTRPPGLRLIGNLAALKSVHLVSGERPQDAI